MKKTAGIGCLAALAALALLAAPAMAGRPGAGSAPFLTIGPGAGPAAMGEAYTAIGGDIHSLYWNPAGLARVERGEAEFVYAPWFEDISYNYLAYLHGDPVFGGKLGGSVTLLDYGSVEVTQIAGQTPVTGLGSTDASDMAVTVGYGAATNSFDWGINAKYVREKLAGYSASAVAIDAGVMVRGFGSPNLSVGAAVQNLGQKMKYQQESFSLPLTFRAGGAYRFDNLPLLLTLDVIMANDDQVQAGFGAEYRLAKMFALRLGYNSANDAGSGLTAGVGFNLDDRFLIDYAYVPYGDLGDAHRIGLNYKFGEARGEGPAPTRVEQQTRPAATPSRTPTAEPPRQPVATQPVRQQPPVPTKTANDWILEGNAAYQNGDFARAVVGYKQALVLEPDNIDVLNNLGVAYYQLGDYANSGSFFNAYLQRSPNDPQAYLFLGICLDQQGYRAQAMECWNYCLQLDPANQTARQYLNQYGLPSYR